eukprot:COSAG03_NODE_34_length_17821_cov_18.833531_16_plen_89_part_00
MLVQCVLAGQQRDKFWNRWSHAELQQNCLDNDLHPDGAMRFLKDRMMRYDFGRTSLTPDETSRGTLESNETSFHATEASHCGTRSQLL